MPKRMRVVGFVFGEEDFVGRRDLRACTSPSDSSCAAEQGAVGGAECRGFRARRIPRPTVAEPERGQDPERGGVGSAIFRGETDEDVVRRSLRVSHLDVEIAVLGRRCPCRAIRIPDRAGRAGRFPRRACHKETRAAGSGSGRAATRRWARPRDTNTPPSRPRRGCPAVRSGRKSALSEWGRRRSRTRGRSRGVARGRRGRRCRPHPSGRRGCGRVRAGK